MKLYIGTSGWNYNHWKGLFYPEGMSSSQWLSFYVRHFNSVELNVTFYHLVNRRTFDHWYEQTPNGFYFVAKGSRFITHTKRIKSVARPLDLFLRNVGGLKQKLLGVLWQFPPAFKKDVGRLEVFLKLLARKTAVRQVFEFRHLSWFDEDVYNLLRHYRACLCIAHSGRYPCRKVITTDFLYLRFHGEALYGSNYSEKDLKSWADFAVQFHGKKTMAFFNNDAQGYAVRNALQFKDFLPLK